jgi:hypothetical protein
MGLFDAVTNFAKGAANAVSDVAQGVVGSAKSAIKDTTKFLGPAAAPLETLALTSVGVPAPIAGALVGGGNALANNKNPTNALVTGGLTAGLVAAGVPQQLAGPLASMANQNSTMTLGPNVPNTIVSAAKQAMPASGTSTSTSDTLSSTPNAPTYASYSGSPNSENITTTPDAPLQDQIASIPEGTPASSEMLTPIKLANSNYQPQQPLSALGQGIVPENQVQIGGNGLTALQMAMLANPKYAAHGGHISGHPTADPTEQVFKTGHYVTGKGDGQSDDIPAMLADGEYVFDADTVAALGNGSNKAGAEKLDQFREAIRAHKRSAPEDKIPPKAKKLTSYLKGI